jgi:hypothetical protein
MKLHWYGRHMAAGPRRRPRLFLTALHAAISYMGTMVRNRVAIARVRLGLPLQCGVSRWAAGAACGAGRRACCSLLHRHCSIRMRTYMCQRGP